MEVTTCHSEVVTDKLVILLQNDEGDEGDDLFTTFKKNRRKKMKNSNYTHPLFSPLYATGKKSSPWPFLRVFVSYINSLRVTTQVVTQSSGDDLTEFLQPLNLIYDS